MSLRLSYEEGVVCYDVVEEAIGGALLLAKGSRAKVE